MPLVPVTGTGWTVVLWVWGGLSFDGRESLQRDAFVDVFVLFLEAALQSFAALVHHGTQRADTCDEAQWVIYKCPQFPSSPCLSKNLMGCECRNRKRGWLTATRLVHYHLTFKHKRVYSLCVKRKRENLLWLILVVIGWQTKQISWVFKTCHLGNEPFFSPLYSHADNKFRNIKITEQTEPNNSVTRS